MKSGYVYYFKLNNLKITNFVTLIHFCNASLMKLFVLSLLGAISFLVYGFTLKSKTALPEQKQYETEYVYVIIMDGPRFTETFGDTSYTHIPYMGKELMHGGVLLYDFRNNGPTYTNAGHTAICTGNYQSISNDGNELPKNPSMFQYYLKEKAVDKTDAWIVSSKGKLEILANTKDKKWWNEYMPYTYCGPNGNSAEYNSDLPTFNKVNALISGENPPHLMLVNFLGADTYAHANHWDDYLTCIKRIDGYIYEIWKNIQSNEKLRNKTTLIVTNDHGRHLDGHKDGFVNHGDNCEGCRHISLLGLGPDFKKDVVIKNYGDQLDISATIAEMLHFCIPTGKGKVMTELFK